MTKPAVVEVKNVGETPTQGLWAGGEVGEGVGARKGRRSRRRQLRLPRRVRQRDPRGWVALRREGKLLHHQAGGLWLPRLVGEHRQPERGHRKARPKSSSVACLSSCGFGTIPAGKQLSIFKSCTPLTMQMQNLSLVRTLIVFSGRFSSAASSHRFGLEM